MYSFPGYFLGNQPFIRQQLSPIYSIYRIIPVYLGGKPGTERVVLYTSSNTGLKAKAEIQRYDESTKKWVVEYSKEAVGIPYFMVESGYWETVGRNVVVLYYNEGSGSFLTYTVIGRRNQLLEEIVHREGIFQGSVWLEGARLVESEGLRFKVWTRRNRRLSLVPFAVPIISGATVIEFSITREGNVIIPQTEYNVPVGSIVQLIRTDMNPETERVLFSYSPIFHYIPHRNAFRITGKGTVQITIIPSGYDWDKAVNVSVTAR